MPVGALKFSCEDHVESLIWTTDSGHYGQLLLCLSRCVTRERFGGRYRTPRMRTVLGILRTSLHWLHFLESVWGVTTLSSDRYVGNGFSTVLADALDWLKKSTVLTSRRVFTRRHIYLFRFRSVAEIHSSEGTSMLARSQRLSFDIVIFDRPSRYGSEALKMQGLLP